MNGETLPTTMEQDWVPAGHEAWKFQTGDGYVGNAYWRAAGAGMTVTRPDGTDLFRKTWSSRQVFPAAWPSLLEYLKGQIRDQVTADRATREQT